MNIAFSGNNSGNTRTAALITAQMEGEAAGLYIRSSEKCVNPPKHYFLPTTEEPVRFK